MCLLPLLTLKSWTASTALFALATASFGGYVFLAVHKVKVILEPEAITVRNVFSTRTLLREEVAGKRLFSNIEGAQFWELVPRDPGKKKLKFPNILRTDVEFNAWFARVPDL